MGQDDGVLVGRERELCRIDEALDAAGAGRATALFVEGDPGVGKTTLLRAAHERATAAGLRTAGVAALEVETQLAGGALDILLLRLGAAPGATVDALRRAVIEGTEDGPLLLLVDDAHWLDEASWAALSFALRRLVADPVAVVVAGRPGTAWHELVPAEDHLVLRPLTVAEGTDLLRVARPGMPAATAALLVEAYGGVPLPLVEVERMLPPEVLEGRSPMPSPVPVSRAVQEGYAAELALLAPDDRLALAVLALDDTRDVTVLSAALGRLGLGPADLDAAEAAGLVHRVPRPVPSHPLVRSAVRSATAAADLRRVHGALGQVLVERGDRTRGLTHLAEAAIGPDPDLAARLGRHAEELSGTPSRQAEAAALAVRAADLVTTAQERARLLTTAAECSSGAEVAALSEQVCELTSDPGLIARAVLARLDMDFRLAPADRGRLAAQLDPLPLPPGLAMRRDVEAVWAAMEFADIPLLDALAGRSHPDERAGWGWPGTLGSAYTYLGRHDRAVPLLRQAMRASSALDPGTLSSAELVGWAFVPGWLGDDTERRRRFADLDRLLRATGHPENVAQAAFFGAEGCRREGRWARAEALLHEAVDLLEGTRQPHGVELARLAGLLAYSGRQEETLRTLRAAEEQVAAAEESWHAWWLPQTRGALALTIGRPEDAVAALEVLRTVPYLGRGCRDAVATGLVDLVEAHAALGDREQAKEVAKELDARLDGVADPFGPAMVARCRAVSGAGAPDEELPAALAHLERTTEEFETARTELLLGEHLRRTRRPRQARPLLARALGRFERTAASPWVDRAARELSAAGGRCPPGATTTTRAASGGSAGRVGAPSSADGRSGLTPQELRVALAVVDGSTNAEVAAALFLSVKTVEFHLGNIYRRLGVRSRGGLGEALRRHGVSG